MRTTEDIVKAIQFRMNQLETLNQQLIEIKSSKKAEEGLTHIFFENESRLNELSTLLEYIQTPKLPRGNSDKKIKNTP